MLSRPALPLGFRSILGQVVANWRANRPPTKDGKSQNVGFKFEWSMVLPLDIFMEWVLQATNAWAPGSPNATRTALALVGQTRSILRGEAEKPDAYAARLRNWIGPAPFVSEISANYGRTQALAHAIRNYLANNPTVRVLERLYSSSGSTMARWVTAHPDGSTTDQIAAWDWDSLSGWTAPTTTYTGAETRGFWSDFWIIVYPTEWPVSGGTGRGQAVTPTAHDAILRLLAQHKGDHAFCRAIIWSYDSAKFTPTSPTADGWYGNWGKNDGAGNVIPARDASARYWIPPLG